MKWKGQRGAAAVEFAIILPILILLIFGAIEFGLLLYNQQVITNASREGARYGIVAQSPRVPIDQIEVLVMNYCSGKLVTFGSSGVPQVTASRTGDTFQSDLTVDVAYTYSFLVLDNLGFGPRTLGARTVMKLE